MHSISVSGRWEDCVASPGGFCDGFSFLRTASGFTAKKRGLVSLVGPIVRRLREEVGFWVTDGVVAQVLVLAGGGRDS